MSVALILALGGTCGTSEEDTSDTGEPPSVEETLPVDETPPAEAPG